MQLCEAAFGVLLVPDGELQRVIAHRSLSPALAEYFDRPVHGGVGLVGRLQAGEAAVQIADAADDEIYRSGAPSRRAIVDLGGARTAMAVALRKDGTYLGAFWLYRQEVRPFTDKQISLLQNFAAQAVIAMENARLMTETHEALEQQTATAEVLQVINSSPGDLTPVFEAMLDKAMRLCGAAFGGLGTWQDERFGFVTVRGPEPLMEYIANNEVSLGSRDGFSRVARGKGYVQFADISTSELYQSGEPYTRALVDLCGGHTTLS